MVKILFGGKMVFDGLKNFFNKIGGVTVDSTKKVGEGVSVPVDKLGKITSKTGKIRSRTGKVGTGLEKIIIQ